MWQERGRACHVAWTRPSRAWRPRRAAARGQRPAVWGSSIWMRSRAADTREWASASAVANGTLPHPGGELLDVADGRHLLLAVDGLVGPLVADGDGVGGPGPLLPVQVG